jgi:hypothetical protein
MPMPLLVAVDTITRRDCQSATYAVAITVLRSPDPSPSLRKIQPLSFILREWQHPHRPRRR